MYKWLIINIFDNINSQIELYSQIILQSFLVNHFSEPLQQKQQREEMHVIKVFVHSYSIVHVSQKTRSCLLS